MRADVVALVALLAACGVPSETPPLSKLATVEGRLTVTPGIEGDVWMFLYRPGEGPPAGPAIPQFLTAVSASRVGTDARYLFANVSPNPFSLYGVLDVNGRFDPNIDVLSQASAGDRVGAPVAINVQPGRRQTFDYELSTLVRSEPPAFTIEGAESDISIGTSGLVLVADTVGRFDPSRVGLRVGLVDADGDGRPDVGDDSLPRVSFNAVLRWLPRPGQATPGVSVVVPLVFNPAPFLAELNGRLGIEVVVDRIQLFPVLQAQSISIDDTGATTTSLIGQPPFGDYELFVVVPGGQFWRMPNQLGATLPSQAVRLHFDRAAP
ncbi:MAG: hypothetical protein JNG84_08060 [Archangium sp.]|nr:hypothetical protein [Archangium sp.]